MNVFEIFATLGLKTDEYDSKLNKAKESASKIGGALATGAKVAGTAIAVASTAIGALTKQSVNAFAEYEQLEGGIQTLYGENTKASQEMMKHASEAWKTAGLSANEYMETAIQSSASMISSLGGDTEKASQLMDMSITDMSDNVNKMGTTMEAVQNAYRGFSRGNFTMLDNLALGFAGTKEGMQELLDKAKEISGVKYDISSYADIVQAIHVVQEEMGIAGTTAKEATETIQGSLSALKSAWTNLVTGFADPNADIGQLIENTVDAGITALDNLLPAIERALVGIGKGIQKIVPIISERLPDIVNDLLPPLLEAGASLVEGLVNALPAILEALIGVIPSLIDKIVTTVIDMLPKLVDAGLKLIIAIAQGIADNLDKIVPSVVKAILTIVETIIDNLPKILDVAHKIIQGLAKGILDALPILIKELPKVIKGIVDFIIGSIPQIIDAGIQLLTSLVEALPEIITAIVEALPQIIDGIVTGLLDNIDKIIEAGITLLVAIVENMPKIIEGIVEKLPEIIVAIVEGLLEGVVKLAEVGVELIKGLWEGIKSMATWLWDKISGFFTDIWEGIKDFFGIHSPSRKGAWLMEMFVRGMGQGIDKNGKKLIDTAEQLNADIVDAFGDGEYDMNASVKMNNATSRSAFMGAQNGYLGGSDSEYEEIIIPQDLSDSGRDLTVILELDRMQLGKAVYRLNNDETQRVGVQLAGV